MTLVFSSLSMFVPSFPVFHLQGAQPVRCMPILSKAAHGQPSHGMPAPSMPPQRRLARRPTATDQRNRRRSPGESCTSVGSADHSASAPAGAGSESQGSMHKNGAPVCGGCQSARYGASGNVHFDHAPVIRREKRHRPGHFGKHEGIAGQTGRTKGRSVTPFRTENGAVSPDIRQSSPSRCCRGRQGAPNRSA